MPDKHLSYVDRALSQRDKDEAEREREWRQGWAEGRGCKKCGEVFENPLPDGVCPKCEQLAIEAASDT